MNSYLRNQVKKLKVYQGISYKEVASYLEVPYSSFYNWLKGYFNFGCEKQDKLNLIVNNLLED